MNAVADSILRAHDPEAWATVADVAASLPGRRRGKRMNPRVVERWCKRGLRGHVLSWSRVGHRRVIRWRDLAEFLTRVSPSEARPSRRADVAAGRLAARRRGIASRAAAAIYEVRK